VEKIMAKKNKNALEVFTEGIGLYFSNFSKFIKYMAFPVLGRTIVRQNAIFYHFGIELQNSSQV
jgi:hypothetical protein